jgi:hypothetical protein
MIKPLLTAALAAAALTAAAAPAAQAAAKGCDPLDRSACLLPFPNDKFTTADKHTKTHRRLNLHNSQMPRNAKGKPIDAKPFKAFDGFSPGSVILTKVRDLGTRQALRRTNAVGLGKLSAYTKKRAPVLVIDTKTGRRWPIWVELDMNASKAKDRLLEIHPAKNFTEGHRYVVVLRNLKYANGKRIPAGKAFAKLRKAKKPGARYKRIFKTLK